MPFIKDQYNDIWGFFKSRLIYRSLINSKNIQQSEINIPYPELWIYNCNKNVTLSTGLKWYLRQGFRGKWPPSIKVDATSLMNVFILCHPPDQHLYIPICIEADLGNEILLESSFSLGNTTMDLLQNNHSNDIRFVFNKVLTNDMMWLRNYLIVFLLFHFTGLVGVFF